MMNQRTLNFTGFLGCAALLGAAYVFQYIDGLEPCPLCIVQRVVMLALAIVFLLAAVHDSKGMFGKIYAILLLLISMAGMVVSGRHVWLQSLPADQVPECGPGLDYMLEYFTLNETLEMLFQGSGSCADADWYFMGLTMPAWVLIWFALLGFTGFLVNMKSRG